VVSMYIYRVDIGAIGGLRIIWNLADIFNALMAVPNLIGLLALVGLIVARKRDYLQRMKTDEFK